MSSTGKFAVAMSHPSMATTANLWQAAVKAENNDQAKKTRIQMLQESLKTHSPEPKKIDFNKMTAKDLDAYEDKDADGPDEIEGTTMMKEGRYGRKLADRLTINEIYQTKKEYVQWVRARITDRSTESLRILALYVELRDQKKKERLLRAGGMVTTSLTMATSSTTATTSPESRVAVQKMIEFNIEDIDRVQFLLNFNETVNDEANDYTLLDPDVRVQKVAIQVRVMKEGREQDVAIHINQPELQDEVIDLLYNMTADQNMI
jgi:hypothetical protein